MDDHADDVRKSSVTSIHSRRLEITIRRRTFDVVAKHSKTLREEKEDHKHCMRTKTTSQEAKALDAKYYSTTEDKKDERLVLHTLSEL